MTSVQKVSSLNAQAQNVSKQKVSTNEVLPCRLCGSTDEVGRPLSGLLSSCRRCGFTWTTVKTDVNSDGPAPEDLYNEDYFSGAGYDHYFVPSARRHEAQVRVDWLRSTGAVQSLLEVGSAGGFFVEAAIAAGIKATGIEVSAAAVRYARDQLGIGLQRGTFESMTVEKGVDAVCAFHVLEHVEDPQVFLDAAMKALRPGGRLLVEVPNIGSTAARRSGTAWPGLQPEYHRWHFSPSSLRRMVAASGFEVVGLDTAVFRFYMPGAYRRRRARTLLPADVRNVGSLRLIHPSRGDLLRLVARRPAHQERIGR